jgi:methylenetetrahydrofolate dehydrogenase (NADP+)/methenyltetrahydrofolate cyclohydrolase
LITLDGKRSAAGVLEEVRAGVARRVAEGKRRPHLAVVLVGHDPASETYVRHKHRDAEQVGITSADHRLPETATTAEVLELVRGLNADEDVSGMLVQTPLPPQIDSSVVVEEIDPARDVDGLHPLNVGRLLRGEEALVACTPAGVLRLLDDYEIEIEGRRAVVLGRSNIVGKPVAVLLLHRNATVTICHSRTRDLTAITREADILVAAIRSTAFVTPDMVREGVVVVDVGINPVDGRLRGDVDPAVAEKAGWMTPVPGGVGPMTRAMLMWNTLKPSSSAVPDLSGGARLHHGAGPLRHQARAGTDACHPGRARAPGDGQARRARGRHQRQGLDDRLPGGDTARSGPPRRHDAEPAPAFLHRAGAPRRTADLGI